MNRIVRGTPGTLALTFNVDEVPTDMDAPPTVTVTDVSGSQIAVGASTRTGVGTYTYLLPAQAQLSPLTVLWAGQLDSDDVSATTYAEIVGAEYFSVMELRYFDNVLLNTTKYPTAKLIAARLAAESDFEDFCHRGFVPRAYRETVIGDGNGALWLSKPEPIRFLSLTVNDEDWSDRTFTRPDDNLHVVTLDSGVWPRDGRVVATYEYGMPTPPVRVKNAAMKLARYRLVQDQSRIDERATAMTIPDFGTFAMATPGMRDSITGIPDVDVVLWDYALDRS